MKHHSLFDTMYKARTLVMASVSVLAAACYAPAARAADAPAATATATAIPAIKAIKAIKADPALAAMVPKLYRDRGVLTVAANPEIAPIKFVNDEGKIAGFTPDLLQAAADTLNLKVQLTQTSFDSMIPGMSANRFDVLLSLSDFSARHKVVTFVDYLNMGETIVASPGKHLLLKSLDDMCGLQVAMARGSAAMQEGNRINVNCVKEGKKPLSLASYPDTNMALLSLTTGASEVAWIDSPAGYYNASKSPAKYEVLYFNPVAPYGIGFGVDENGKQLATAVQQALLKLQKDGVYDLLMKKWGLSAKDAKPLFPINGAQL